MKHEQRVLRAAVVALLGAVPFGVWQKSITAGWFMFFLLLVLGGAAVALEHSIELLEDIIKEK